MNESQKLKLLLKSLENSKMLVLKENNKHIVKFVFKNDKYPNIEGELAISPDFEILYLSFGGLTNKHFARGEMLEVAEVEDFIRSAIKSEAVYKKQFIGSTTLSFGTFKLNKKL